MALPLNHVMDAEFVTQSQEGFGKGTTLIRDALHRMPDILDGTLSVCVEVTLALLGRLICCFVVLLQKLYLSFRLRMKHMAATSA